MISVVFYEIPGLTGTCGRSLDREIRDLDRSENLKLEGSEVW